uniref:mitogen-activated protein kinase kinase n=1 Tax=Globisporangium ultimum (strain ATCC 200006 / CBS 805.95 / DAOM BR144) TaxID=431595 RepID=K3W7N3_GLOUD
MDSPEGAEFGEVAHDGPAELGKRTKKVKRLGKGAGGTVYLSIYLPELKLVAVKEVLVYKEEERHTVKHELHALHENLAPLGTAPHSPTRGSGGGFGSFFSANAKPTVCPYQVSFYGAYLTPAKCAVSIVMEFMDMGSLQDLVCNISTPEPVVRHAAFCCLTALEHMHNQRMIHRDIKPANILLNRKGDFKVADFGLAGTLPKSASNFSEFEGTMMYMAPERITGKSYSYVSDVWSLGVSLFALATGAYPFAVDDGFFGLEEAICTDPLPPMPNRFTPECRDFMKGLIRRDPGSRFTATRALSHPFLRGYEGSAAHHDFEDLWRKMPLRPVMKPEDAAKIVQAVTDYSLRHSNEVALL